ncbi:MAG TPA: YDG/SRA domain-containing protein [Pyrinomonadaceae bacterium]|jgi:hypothetical protein|nr:YDG/SRA domain-containing protein [Pyrinomonadaceae bacterium]
MILGSEVELRVGDIVTWAIVSGIHRSRNGIYHKNGRLISLLTDFGKINPCYPDFHGGTQDVIHYTGSGRRGNQKLDAPNRALRNAIPTGHAVPLFNKVSVNRWEYLGRWTVVSAEYVFDESRERMVWRFELRKCPICDC